MEKIKIAKEKLRSKWYKSRGIYPYLLITKNEDHDLAPDLLAVTFWDGVVKAVKPILGEPDGYNVDPFESEGYWYWKEVEA